MAAEIDELIARVSDPALRELLTASAARLRDTKDFGLVFERHIPENVRLYSHPVRRGMKVQDRSGTPDKTWQVRRIANGEAHLVDADGEEATKLVDELVVVRQFGEPIYPGFARVGAVERGGDKPFHTVINGENYHAVETLLYPMRGQVDCIYLDPPYNTGAKDWKYDNDYVDENDAYRHSKWLAFMERRLVLAKQLLNPDDSVLIVTIDEKEYLRLGLLLEQVFAGCRVQMVSITISPRGTSRSNEFSRVDEYAFFVFLGAAAVTAGNGSGEPNEVRWKYLRRTELESGRTTRPRQFYPVYIDTNTDTIVKLGDPLKPADKLEDVPAVPGAVAVYPINADGVHLTWGLTAPSLQKAIDGGYVRVTPGTQNQPYTIAYLTAPNIKKAENGTYEIVGTRPDGSNIVVIPGGKAARPNTVWREPRHDAGAYGTSLLRSLLPGRTFPFPKSLYAVEDTLRIFVKNKPEALVLDFFAGSGTTAHAVFRLNHQDGGHRRSIVVTNNEVSEDEGKALREAGHLPGTPAWEALGIFEHITLPRVTAALTGRTPDGDAVKGDYKFVDEFPMAEGFEENVEFLTLNYLDRNDVSRGKAFEAIAPLLWMKAGSIGAMIAKVKKPFAVPDEARYAVLFDINQWQAFAEALRERSDVTHVFVVTDSPAQYQQVLAELPPAADVSMLYEDYLRNFEINLAGAL